jgi:hypothetical protein
MRSFSFLQANGRRRKNTIHSLDNNGQVCFSHEEEEVLFQHFSSQFSQPAIRNFSLNWEAVGLPRHGLAHLEEHFTKEEVRAVTQEKKNSIPQPLYIGGVRISTLILKTRHSLSTNY